MPFSLLRLSTLLCLALGLIGHVQAAGQVQGQLTVQLIIGSGCTVTNGSDDGSTNNFGSINFGNYATLGSIIDGNSVGAVGGGAIGLQCTNGLAYSVALNSGANANGNQRRMASAGQFINYNLYKNAARTQLWGNGANGGTALTANGTGLVEDVVVYGRVPTQTTPAAGTYLDTVQVTVAW